MMTLPTLIVAAAVGAGNFTFSPECDTAPFVGAVSTTPVYALGFTGGQGDSEAIATTNDAGEQLSSLSVQELTARLAQVAGARRTARGAGDAAREEALADEFHALLQEIRSKRRAGEPATPASAGHARARDEQLVADETAEAIAAMSREELAARLGEVAVARWAAHDAGDVEREEALVAEFQALVQELRSRDDADGDPGQVRLALKDVAVWDMYVFLLQESGKKVSVGAQALDHRVTIEDQFIPRERPSIGSSTSCAPTGCSSMRRIRRS